MPSFLPFDIIERIADVIGEREDIDLLKELALVSHSFLPMCRKHLFATVELYDGYIKLLGKSTSSKKGFIKLLGNNPDVVKYIRKLTYYDAGLYDGLLSPILPNLLQTISHLESFTISFLTPRSSKLDWITLDDSLKTAWLHLIHLPTINHINLTMVENFPFSDLTACVNLNRLDIWNMEFMMSNGSSENDQSDIPTIHRFSTVMSSMATRELLHTKRRDGRPAFNFMDLKQLSVIFYNLEDEQNARYLLQNVKHLERLYILNVYSLSPMGLHDMIFPSASTLKALDLTIPLYHVPSMQLAGLCEELKAMAGYNVLEALYLRVRIEGSETEDTVGSIFQKLEEVLVKSEWSMLNRVSFDLSITCCPAPRESIAMLNEVLLSLPEKYLNHLPTFQSVSFSYSVEVMDCGCKAYPIPEMMDMDEVDIDHELAFWGQD